MLLDDITTRIELLSAIAGYTVDKGRLSEDTDKRIVVFESDGKPSRLGFSDAGLRYEFPMLQILVRGEVTDYEGPRDVIEAIYQDLPKVQATALSGTTYFTIKPQGPPVFYRRDENERNSFSVRFLIWKSPESL